MGIRDADALYRPRVWSRQVLHTWLVVRYYTLSRDVYTRIVLQRDLIPSPYPSSFRRRVSPIESEAKKAELSNRRSQCGPTLDGVGEEPVCESYRT